MTQLSSYQFEIVSIFSFDASNAKECPSVLKDPELQVSLLLIGHYTLSHYILINPFTAVPSLTICPFTFSFISGTRSFFTFTMQYLFALFALIATIAAVPSPKVRRGINRALVPNFGVTAGTPSPKQHGSCQGLNDAVIPCFCPPSRDEFIDKLNQFVKQGTAGQSGIPITFPEGTDPASITAQNNALVNTFQNFNDTQKGVGCPQGAAVFKEGSTFVGDAPHATG